MTHAFSMVPNFSAPLPAPAVRECVPFHADPVLAAIGAHEEAYAAYQVAPDAAVELAFIGYVETTERLLATSCATRPGAFALLRHLRWWLNEEAVNAPDVSGYVAAEARERELAMLLNCASVTRIPVALPLGRMVSVPVLPEAPAPLVIDAEPVRTPALVRLGRAMSSAGELLSALVLIGGGCALIGLASLI